MSDKLRRDAVLRILAANLRDRIGDATQGVIARRAGLSRSSLNNIMLGKTDPKFSNVMALADVLNVRIADLAEAEGDRTEPSPDAMKLALLFDGLKTPTEKALLWSLALKIAGMPPSSE